MRRRILFSTLARRARRDVRDVVRAGAGVRAHRRRLQARAELADAAVRRIFRLEDAASAAGGARSASRGAPRDRDRPTPPRPAGQGPTNQPGISGLAIDQNDRIYVFNRGAKPVMVFNTDGKLVASGGDQELNGKKLDPNWQHSGAVDWDGNVYMIERDAHRIVKLSPKMDKVLLQLGTTMEKGNDATHFDLPVRNCRTQERQHHRDRRLWQ